MSLINYGRLRDALSGFAADAWTEQLIDACSAKLSDGAHGDLAKWQAAVENLPVGSSSPPDVVDGAVRLRPHFDVKQTQQAVDSLQALRPWRKGPFRVDDMLIDSEWRSDLKWARLETAIESLAGRRVLDVGCGNGYYALRMMLSGARLLVGVDPTLLFVAQFAALTKLMQPLAAFVLPLRLHEVPGGAPEFDTVFSMGVLYHQRDPGAHLQQLRGLLRDGGQLVLETLILPGDNDEVRIPESRYARMRNVWHLPTRAHLLGWLRNAGFSDAVVVDEALTTIDEQRTTDWMPFESLREALDPVDPTLTVEGLPAPFRAVITAANGPATTRTG